MSEKLPIKLNKQPLIDAVFEIRFSSKLPASVVLPGLLFNELKGVTAIEPLPIAQIPKETRDHDPNLKYAPLNRLDWGAFFISLSDHSINISCKNPYPGWSAFKPAIEQFVELVNRSNFIVNVERYSIKYVDIMQNKTSKEIVSMLNLELVIAGNRLSDEKFSAMININKDIFNHTVQIVSSVQALLINEGRQIEGAIIDIDTVVELNNISMPQLMEDFSSKLENLHSENKSMFFACLTKDATQSLDPVYD